LRLNLTFSLTPTFSVGQAENSGELGLTDPTGRI
jgi:hypothetical protein